MKKTSAAYFLSLILFSFFIRCAKKSSDPSPDNSFNGREYIIAQGTHDSNHPIFFPTKKTVLTFRALFDSSAIYKTVDSLNQTDTNKLYGLSDCGDLHDTNSARFGWRWVNDQLEIMAYWYVDSIRPEPIRVATVALNTVNSYSIAFNSDNYIFTVNDTNVVQVSKTCDYNSYRYYLYPYFGGNENAPHEVRLWIEED